MEQDEDGALIRHLSKAQEELAELECRAGLREKTEDESLGPAASPDQQSGEAGEDARERTRRLVFNVADMELRRAIIAKYRECDTAYEALVDRQVRSARAGVERVNRRRTSGLPWLAGGVIAAGAALFGHKYWETEGAIALGLLGVFFAQWQINNARIKQDAELKASREELIEAQVSAREGCQDEWFTSHEARTGEPDTGNA